MADKVIGAKLTLDANDGKQSLKEFKQLLVEAKGDLVAMTAQFGDTSKEAAQAAKKVAEMQDALGDAKSLVDAFNPDTKFRAFGAAVNTVVGGLSAVTGVMGLLGTESEETQKLLLKVQSALALSNGISQLQEGVQTFKNLNAVIQQTTIYQKANAVATNLATGAMRLFGAATVQTGVAFNVLKGIIAASGIGLLILGIGILISKISEWTEATDDQAKSQEALKRATDNLNNSINDQLQFMDAIGKKTLLEAQIAGKSGAELLKIQEQTSKNRIKVAQDTVNEILKIGGDASVATEALQKEIDRDQIEQLERQLKTVTDLKDQAAENEKKRLEREKLALAQAEKDQEAALNSKLGGIGRVTVQREKTPEEIALENRLAAQKTYSEERRKLILGDAETDEKYTNDYLANLEMQKANEEALFAQKQFIASATVNILASVSDIVGQQTAAGKVLAIASATIDTYRGATLALASSPPPFNFISAAAVVAAGIANVKKILSTQVPGAPSSGSLPSSASVSAPLTLQKPGNQTTSLDANSLNAIGNATSRAYVLETDIANNQERTTRLNRAARLGG